MWTYALRRLWKSPGLVGVVIVTLALGIGATTAIFSVVDAAILRPLPFPDSDRLVVLDDTRIPGQPSAFSFPNFIDLDAQSQTVPTVAAYTQGYLTLTGHGEARRVLATVTTWGLFDTLAVRPALGRSFTPGEEAVSLPRVAILSHGYWNMIFDAAPDVLGKTLTLDGIPHTIVGVAPAGFQFPLQGPAPDIYATLPPGDAEMRKNRNAHYLSAVGRLAPGRTVSEARAELATIHARLEAEYPDEVGGRYFTVARLHDFLVKDIRGGLLIILGAVGFVLLIACVNVANLLLARAAGRHRELAIRAALGARRRRLVAELLVDSMVLSALGGGVGALLAMWGVDALRTLIPPEVGGIRPISVDTRVLAFAVGIALVTGLLFGLIPAWIASRAHANEALQSTTSRGGVRHAVTRSILVVAEIAFAMLLLVGAGLMLKSFARLQEVDPGFDPEGITLADISLPDTSYPSDVHQVAFYRRFLEQLAAVPGADAVAVGAPVPLSPYNLSFTLQVVGRPPEPTAKRKATQFRAVSPGYHRAMRIPLLAGRLFEPADDDPNAPPTILISEALARREFPGEDPLGKKLSIGYRRQIERTIVGVVGSVKANGLDVDAEIEVYTPFSQTPLSFFYALARSRGPDVAAGLRAAVAAADKGVPVEIKTMRAMMSESLAKRRLNTLLLGLFATVAVLLALVGIYGVVSHGVTQRQHEMSVRLALGARPGQVVGLVVGQGLRLALVGVAVGIGLAAMLARLLAGLLYGVDAIDPPTFVVTALLLTAVTVAASYVPARRAGRLEPMGALRSE